MTAAGSLGPGPSTTLRRQRQRGRHDRATIHAILDEALVCHLGLIAGDRPVVVPTAYAREDDHLYLHGAPANAALGAAGTGATVCITVTLVYGLVLARSALHHSLKYRSVMVFGTASIVTGPAEKRRAMALLLEHAVPGRAADARPPTDAELRATKVVRVDIAEGSAKVRTGGPNDEPEDQVLAVWAGHVPFSLVAGAPVADPADALPARPALAAPGYLPQAGQPARPRASDKPRSGASR